MKAVLVSDSHGRFGGLQEIIEREAPFDMLLHAGDIQGGVSNLEDWAGVPVYVVKGNCDWSGDFPQERIVEFGSDRIFLTHGHRYGVKVGIETVAAAAERAGATIAVHGHTHIPNAEERYGVIVLCPGSVSEPRQANRRATYAILERIPSKGLTWEIKYL
ncbi:MAG: metallophosphoesterase family protein [Lachnospiraceae bacterium]|nr:metallophosphoesterase family protein [Lachnospiraceae bacterium]